MRNGRTQSGSSNSGAHRTERPSIVPKWRLALSWLSLGWERVWPVLWPATGIAGLYLLLALFDLLPALPGWLHAALLGVFFLALLWTLLRGLSVLQLPHRRSLLRRIEADSALAHRPLEALQDDLVAGAADADARALWRLHQERMRAAVARLRIGWPRPGLIRRDPYALRVALGVGLVVGLLVAGADSGERIMRALTPQLDGRAVAATAKLDAWITPPEYTRKAPIFLTSGGGGETIATPDREISVPEGSKLIARVSGGPAVPVLRGYGPPVEFAGHPKGGYSLEHELMTTADAAILQSERDLGSWSIKVLPDNPPSIQFARRPEATQRNALRIDFDASDDYGVTRALATIDRSDGIEESSALAKLPPIEIDLVLSSQTQREIRSTSFHDLTPHPWAGLPVKIQLSAFDALDQRGDSDIVEVVLPERVFSHPVARAIVEQRRELALEPDKNRGRVAAVLEIIAWDYDKYRGDVVVFMALNLSSRRISAGKSVSPEQLRSVMDLLWETALRLEDGSLSLSERSLRDAELALREALARDASDEEIERLVQELQRALDEYLDALAEMMRNMPRPQDLAPMDPQSMMLSRQDLKKMLDQIRELSRSGQRDAAQQMLSQLQRMLENMRMQRFAEPSGEQRRAMEMLNELQDILRGQQDLLDQTFREAQRRGQVQEGGPQRPPGMPQSRGQPPSGQPGQPQRGEGPAPMMEEAELQEALRRRLGELMRELGEMSGSIPQPFGNAEGAMRESSDELGEGQAGQAVPPQTRAIDQLQEGARAATEQLMQQFGQQGGQPRQGQPAGAPQEQDRDPFGRTTDQAGRGINAEDVDIPDEIQTQDAREIRDELRRRAGQQFRPKLERDYIERLLRQF